jgi:nucleoside-diphosphate-sugar epimerase
LNELAGKKVLVTGATGFIGAHLTRRLVAEGARVSVFAVAAPDCHSLTDVLDRISVHEVDIADAETVSATMMRIRPEIVFHLAAVGTSGPSITPQLATRVNVEGTRHLLEAACQTGVQRFLHTGTAYEYGHIANGEGLRQENWAALDVYAASKAQAQSLVREYARRSGLPAVTLRLFAVYGPGQSVQSLVPSAVCAALEGRDFPMTPGEQRRDFVFVSDVVEGYLSAATAAAVEGSTIDLGTGQASMVHDVVTRLFQLVGSQGRPLVGALPYRSGEMMVQVADTRPARELLDWQATTSLEDGLRQMVEWYRQARADPVFHTSPANISTISLQPPPKEGDSAINHSLKRESQLSAVSYQPSANYA